MLVTVSLRHLKSTIEWAVGRVFVRVFSVLISFFERIGWRSAAGVSASCLLALRTMKFAHVYWDGEDWIHRWGSTGAVTQTAVYNPIDNTKNLDLFLYRFTPVSGSTIVDVGVENGAELPFFCNAVGQNGRVFAIEADPNCCRRLLKLRSVLSLSNLTVVEAAVGSLNGVVQFTQDRGSIANGVVRDDNYEGQTVSVDARLLEDLLDLSQIDFLKVNIEGMEDELLRGLTGSLQIDNFCISCHDFLGPHIRTFDFVFSWLVSRGYSVCRYSPLDDSRPWRNFYIFGSTNTISS